MIVGTPWTKIEPTHIPMALGSCNLGDHIQTEAAARLWNCRNFVDREHPQSWPSDAIIPLIGWWLQGGEEFLPPCQSIVVGIHIQNEYRALITQRSIDYLKLMVREQGFPAMCRDISTRDYFRSLGMEAEFGGCVTLTLPTYHWERSGKYSVDCKHPTNGFTKLTHMHASLRQKSVAEKLAMASEYIEKYRKAEEVETTRLHCMLPCRASGTKVNFAKSEVYYQLNRLTGYLD